MDPDLRSCTHLERAAPGPLPCEIVEHLDFDGGLTDALVRCRTCGAPALLRLLDAAGPGLSQRILRVSGLREADVAVHLRDAARGSCDLSRAAAELASLLHCAGPVGALWAFDATHEALRGACAVPDGLRVPGASWREWRPAPEDDRWFRALGLEKPGVDAGAPSEGGRARRRYTGGCHCGAVRFAVWATPGREVRDCNCSICAKKGFLHLIVPEVDFDLLRGDDALHTYTFHTRTAKHLFCGICGIAPFYRPRSHPESWDVNVRCLDADAGSDFVVVPFDGRHWEANVATLPGAAVPDVSVTGRDGE